MLGRSQEAADYLSRSRTPPAQESPRGQQWFEPELKPLNIRHRQRNEERPEVLDGQVLAPVPVLHRLQRVSPFHPRF